MDFCKKNQGEEDEDNGIRILPPFCRTGRNCIDEELQPESEGQQDERCSQNGRKGFIKNPLGLIRLPSQVAHEDRDDDKAKYDPNSKTGAKNSPLAKKFH